jgi:hypothetical protein
MVSPGDAAQPQTGLLRRDRRVGERVDDVDKEDVPPDVELRDGGPGVTVRRWRA